MCRYTFPIKVVGWATAAMFSSPACMAQAAQNGNAQPELQRVERLCFFEPTYFAWGHSKGDDNAWRVHYSFSYLLNPAPIQADKVPAGEGGGTTLSCNSRRSSAQPNKVSWDVFFKMTGEFDFYAGTRDSGPVINRMSNPGLHARRLFTKGDRQNVWWLNWLDVTAEHRSDGQVIEVRSAAEAERAQQAYDKHDYTYFDGVSRGSNYTTLAAQWSREVDDAHDNKVRVHASVKKYWTRDSQVTWGPKANQGLAVSDYDRVRASLMWSRKGAGCFSGKANDPIEASAEWVLGDNGLKTQSLNLDFMYPCRVADWELPLYVRYHVGPMNTLSNYTQFVQAYWVGLKFNTW